ncbi:hypothetical protein Tco_0081919 [Tanacetum coccineum]
MAQDIRARAAVHIFNRTSFAIARGMGARIVSRLSTIDDFFYPPSLVVLGSGGLLVLYYEQLCFVRFFGLGFEDSEVISFFSPGLGVELVLGLLHSWAGPTIVVVM